MEDEEMNDAMNDVLAHSLEGNALGIKDAINDLMTARAMDALQSMKVDVAQSIYGNYASDEASPEDTLPINDLDPDFEFQDDEEIIADDDVEDLFAELDQLTDTDVEDEADYEESDEQDEG